MEKCEILDRPFVIDETPYCMWELEIEKRNESFINAINPEYFDFIADSFFDKFNNSDDKIIKTNASIALRMHYSLCLETMFSLIFATVQAPHCLSGWILKYNQRELLSLIQKISDGKKIYSGFHIDKYSWQKIIEIIFAYLNNNEISTFLLKHFSYILKKLAIEYLDKNFRDEYNSLKHGFRNKSGGFSITLGFEKIRGETDSPKDLINIGGSEYGSSFLLEKKLTKSVNFRVIPKSFNWNPENLYSKSKLVTLIIYNTKTFLLLKNNLKSDGIQYKYWFYR